jgi:hypothetical protein
MKTIRKATESDAQAMHIMTSAIPWISAATKSTDGFTKTREACSRGEIFVLIRNSAIVSMMILTQDKMAASLGHNFWRIPLIVTNEAEQRKGHARALVRAAKQIAGYAVIHAHAKNEKSLALLVSEGCAPVEGEADMSGHPLYQWTAVSAAE